MQAITVEFAVMLDNGIVTRIGKCHIWHPDIKNRSIENEKDMELIEGRSVPVGN